MKVVPQAIPMARQSTAANGQCYQMIQEGVQGNEAKLLDEIYRRGSRRDGQGTYA